ncbi:MAG: UPF0182 family protein [Candidatus Bathyarchaeota archaeon]|nr:UPF0182 family protein [Candidatus Bathyarchaeota archaeon]
MRRYRLSSLITVSIVVGIVYSFVLLPILQQLQVFNDPVSYPILAVLLLANSLSLTASIIVTLIAVYGAAEFRWIIFILAIVSTTICVPVFKLTMDYALSLDIEYTYILSKVYLNVVSIRLIGGTLILTALLASSIIVFSDPRVYIGIGRDGKRHIYVKSKLLSLVKLFTSSRDRLIGVTYDHQFILKPSVAGVDEVEFNDKLRLIPYGALWMLAKFLAVFVATLGLGSQLAVKIDLLIHSMSIYGVDFQTVISKIASTLLARVTPGYVTPIDYPINEALTLEIYYNVLYNLAYILAVLWILRLILASIGDTASIVLSRHLGLTSTSSVIRIAANIACIAASSLLVVFLRVPIQVFDASTPYHTLTIGLALIASTCLAVILRLSIFTGRMYHTTSRIYRAIVHQYSSYRVALLAIVIVGLLSPSIYARLAIETQMQGKAYEYLWIPAYLPTIKFTRWAYSVDDIERIGIDSISINDTRILERTRIFTAEAARLNLRPYVGVNWMSIDDAIVDIVYLKGKEYWVAILTPVRPPYAGDVDVWRANHLILTHSEKVLALDSTSAEIIDIRELLNLTRYPTLYYGEGELWREVDEVYVGVPGFQEIHLPGYIGPSGYDSTPDYLYRGFWRFWKFFWGFRWDFAQGVYGDIKALVDRDCRNRVSKLLLPNLYTTESGYIIFDEKGNIYLLYWIWASWPPPHEYLDWPSHEYEGIQRLLGFVIVDLYSGVIDGYLLENYRSDYITEYYRAKYSLWSKPIPEWIKRQLKYPEEFLESQIDCYNWYFQEDFSRWQSNQFYDFTRTQTGALFEDVRYITIRFEGEETWCAVRLVEWYRSPSRNLAGMYIAPSGHMLGNIYFLSLEDRTVIGPWTALSVVSNNPDVKRELTLHPNWRYSNILLYAMGRNLVYLIPFYGEERDLVLPAMVVAVDAERQEIGSYVILNPKNPDEVRIAALKAVEKLEYGRYTLGREEKITELKRILEDLGLTIVEAEALYPHVKVRVGDVRYARSEDLGYIKQLIRTLIVGSVDRSGRIYIWFDDSRVNIGVMVKFSEIIELHYVSIEI